MKRWPWLSQAIVLAIVSVLRTEWLAMWADVGDTYAGVLDWSEPRDVDYPDHRDAVNVEWGGGD